MQVRPLHLLPCNSGEIEWLLSDHHFIHVNFGSCQEQSITERRHRTSPNPVLPVTKVSLLAAKSIACHTPFVPDLFVPIPYSQMNSKVAVQKRAVARRK
jgi:hypothetical protein